MSADSVKGIRADEPALERLEIWVVRSSSPSIRLEGRRRRALPVHDSVTSFRLSDFTHVRNSGAAFGFLTRSTFFKTNRDALVPRVQRSASPVCEGTRPSNNCWRAGLALIVRRGRQSDRSPTVGSVVDFVDVCASIISGR